MYDEIDMTPTMKISFDDEGTIVSIGPEPVEGYSYFEKDYKDVEPLMTLKDDPMNYVVRFDNVSKGYALISVKSNDSKEYKITQLKQYDQSFYSLLLHIDSTNCTAILKCDEAIKNKLNINTFKFYFTKKDNPNYLYQIIDFTINDKVENEIFADIENISIYTVRNLERLCYEIV
jgi:hypothetical protein